MVNKNTDKSRKFLGLLGNSFTGSNFFILHELFYIKLPT